MNGMETESSVRLVSYLVNSDCFAAQLPSKRTVPKVSHAVPEGGSFFGGEREGAVGQWAACLLNKPHLPCHNCKELLTFFSVSYIWL